MLHTYVLFTIGTVKKDGGFVNYTNLEWSDYSRIHWMNS